MVVGSNKGIFVLVIDAIDRLLLVNIPHRLPMKTDNEKCVDVNDICSNPPEKN